MSDVVIKPCVRCDNCGATAEKQLDYSKKWVRPKEWGDCRVAPTNLGSAYPNNIGMTDLCPPCLGLVHDAVGEALEAGRRALKPDNNGDSGGE